MERGGQDVEDVVARESESVPRFGGDVPRVPPWVGQSAEIALPVVRKALAMMLGTDGKPEDDGFGDGGGDGRVGCGQPPVAFLWYHSGCAQSWLSMIWTMANCALK